MKTIAISIHAEFYTKNLLEAMPLNIKSQKEMLGTVTTLYAV